MATQEAFITPSVLEWAIRRAGVSVDSIDKKADRWIKGEARPTLRQAIDIAKKLRIPFGYLYLQSPPKEQEIIPDLRTIDNTMNTEMSLELKTLLSNTKFKQEWFKDYLIQNNDIKKRVVGRFLADSDTNEIAKDMTEKLDANSVVAKKKEKDEVLRFFIKSSEKLNIIVMKNKNLGGSKKPLSLAEFRGFAIYDDVAPLVFINANDTKAAQIFTLMHELAHLWIGQSGISDLEMQNAKNIELKCNEIAAKILMPEDKMRQIFKEKEVLNQLDDVARIFSVSTLALLNRARNLSLISHSKYREHYANELRAIEDAIANPNTTKKNSGFAPPQKMARSRNGDLFSFAVTEAVLNGKESYTNGARLLDYRDFNIIEKVSEEFGLFK